MSEQTFVVLGSNVEPRRHLVRAREELARRLRLVAESAVYESAAVGAPGSPPFLNAAVALDVEVGPVELKLAVLRPIEAELGRVRGRDPNAPRTIDLDIVRFGDLAVHDGERGLHLPDPEIARYAHLALPLADLVPDWRPPGADQPLRRIARRLARSVEIRRVAPSIAALDELGERLR